MPMTPLEELRHSCSHVRTMVDALRKEIATAGGWSMLDRKDGHSLELLKK